MKFYRITTCDHVNDLSGEGAFLHGGRWNSKGTRMLYTAESMALSMLEALAHVTMVNQKRGYCRVVIGLVGHQPGNVVRETRTTTGETTGLGDEVHQPMPENWCKKVDTNELPEDFRSNPGPDALRAIGDQFIEEGKFLALKVPSVVVPDSFNYLLNPMHFLFKSIKIIESSPIVFDQRIIKLKEK